MWEAEDEGHLGLEVWPHRAVEPLEGVKRSEAVADRADLGEH